ncbi:DUF3365 domain-containing protein [Aestuariirhabdus sp. Z084]|uniref:Tll0287-like domain-containing protein n=1 Tax=Aestuariirhabdus haliotis TaxID=2918751 RepID=UPI00201B4472|nr:DUF3365 domain-containing protein [Aestuariirhabdus haliotis]MCL6416466.1 DUF3365 domain-containing protein [Aestuariirhabdus haliotis]MCL6420456.1 DUF3365 domain-containing protein [Aestuariirhabdus haliotis]
MCRLFAVIAVVTAFASSSVLADELAVHRDEARAISKEFGQQLQAVFKPAMERGGAIHAIDACNVQATPIANERAQASGWKVGRTSLRTRNSANGPDGWERAVLVQFERRKRSGENPANLEYFEMVETGSGSEVRYMKAIPTAGVCLACHGRQIDPDVAAHIEKLYPDDRATGFSQGDLRGAFSLSKTLP